MTKHIAVIGAGISGLTAAYWLQKKGYRVTVLEKNASPGGTMESVFENGFLFDRGPNTGLDTTPLIRQLVEDVGLGKEMVYASKISDKRYILREGKLHPLPMNPAAFIKTSLFSWKAKLRLLCEPFIPKSRDGYYQSMADFVIRRLGREFLDYAIDPFVSGVSAGDPNKLSVKSAFPRLYRLEEVYGGLIRGAVLGARERKRNPEQSKQSAQMFSFLRGMQSLPAAIAQTLGDAVRLNADVHSIQHTGDEFIVGYSVKGAAETFQADAVVLTIPSYAASEIIRPIDRQCSEHLDAVYYPPVALLYAVYKKQDIVQPLDGFGFLIPSKEQRQFLGAIWNSVIFPNRTGGDYAAFTLFIGGARAPELCELPQQNLETLILPQFQKIMRISAPPVYTAFRLWERAIPQYNIGYIEHERYFEQFENTHPGLFLGGNYRGGIAVGDCIKNADAICRRVEEYLRTV